MVKRTQPGAEGRLFPLETWDHGFSLSLQADRSGYQCWPQERLDTLEAYDEVEAVIYRKGFEVVDPVWMDLPGEVLAKFTLVESGGVAVGCRLTKDDVEAVRQAILQASLNPNAGIPVGRIGWSSRRVYHGTSESSARDIEINGIGVDRSHGGYFGHAFYVAEDEALARSNYAEFTDGDEEPAVLEFVIEDGARILDMRNPEDAASWSASKASLMLGHPDMAFTAVAEGIQGVYDRSVGGLAIFDPKALSVLGRVHDHDVNGYSR